MNQLQLSMREEECQEISFPLPGIGIATIDPQTSDLGKRMGQKSKSNLVPVLFTLIKAQLCNCKQVLNWSRKDLTFGMQLVKHPVFENIAKNFLKGNPTQLQYTITDCIQLFFWRPTFAQSSKAGCEKRARIYFASA